MAECYRTKPVCVGRDWYPSRPQERHWDVPRLSKIQGERWEVPEVITDDDVCVGVLTSEPEVSLTERFREQADKWAKETRHLSSPSQMMAHPSYQAIMGMAQEDKGEVVRLMLLDLQQHRSQWFWALSYLTQTNPISQRDAGKMDKMIEAWVRWGKAEKVI